MKNKNEIEHWFPSNGSEGEGFMSTWCTNCRKDPAMRNPESKTYCSILTRSMTECSQIKQWIIKDGKPCCTSFVHYQEAYKVKRSKIKKTQLTLF